MSKAKGNKYAFQQCFEIYIAAIDAIMSEMNHRFNEVGLELLVCMSSLNPRHSFSNFDMDKFERLVEIYVKDFITTIVY